MEKVDTLVVDKTGTLTEGKPRLASVVPVDGFSESEVLRLAASLELASEHPLAAAIVAGRASEGWRSSSPRVFSPSPGKESPALSTAARFSSATWRYSRCAGRCVKSAPKADGLRREGQTMMFLAVDGRAAGLVGVADPIKESSREAIAMLRQEGVRIVMLTGDCRATAETVARQLGLDDVVAEVLPDQKIATIRRLQGEGSVVAMAGDGVNDAPALAQADVGIAMGTGTDVAIESAGVTLVKGDLRGIVRARRLSQATMRNIRQNLFFAFIYNAVGVPIAAGVLYPFFGLLLSPMIAAAAMSFSSVSVITNVLRLRHVKL